mgnify:CR=1 FL=1
MIAEPINDRDCLLPTTHYVVGQLGRHDLQKLARKFRDTNSLAEWIRSLPQLDDTGHNDGMPTIACDTPQRARLPTSTPNCYERALLYLAVAEMIDPVPIRQMATRDTPFGRHTVVIENGTEVNLNPSRRVEYGEPNGDFRNASLHQLADERKRRRRPSDLESRRRQPPEWVRVIAWCVRIAECHADVIDEHSGGERMRRVRGFFAHHGILPRDRVRPSNADQTDFELSLAAVNVGAEHYGSAGKWAAALYHRALEKMGLVGSSPYKRNAHERSFGEGLATLHDFAFVDYWDPYRNLVELSHLQDPDWRNCGCGMPRNVVELEDLHRNIDWKSIGQDTLGVVHGIGGGILRTYGLGGVADSLGNIYEQQGWIKPRTNRTTVGSGSGGDAVSSSGGGGGGGGGGGAVGGRRPDVRVSGRSRVWQGVQSGSAQLEEQSAAERERPARDRIEAERRRLIREREQREAEREDKEETEETRPMVGSLAAV